MPFFLLASQCLLWVNRQLRKWESQTRAVLVIFTQLPIWKAHYRYQQRRRSLEVTILVIIDVLSLAGNIILWIVIMGTPALRTISDYLVLEMSASCILISVISMPSTVYAIAAEWLTFPGKTCDFMGYFVISMYIFSFHILALISFNRYGLICHPGSYSKVFNKANSIAMMIGGSY